MIILTGTNGFLGKYIYNELIDSHKIITVGINESNNICLSLKRKLEVAFPPGTLDGIIHVAGKAHVNPKNQNEIFEFENVNFMGTVNLCNWICNAQNKPLFFIYISTVAVYGLGNGVMIDESWIPNPNTPYGISKLKAENFLLNWGKKNNIKILILRLPLVLGDNPPGNLGKMIRGIKRGTYFSIADGLAKKSMVLAQDVAEFIHNNLNTEGIYNLTDGIHPSFADIEDLISKALGKGKPMNIPYWLANFIGKIGDFIPKFPINSETILKITSNLTFSDKKAREQLNWNPKNVIDNWKIKV